MPERPTTRLAPAFEFRHASPLNASPLPSTLSSSRSSIPTRRAPILTAEDSGIVQDRSADVTSTCHPSPNVAHVVHALTSLDHIHVGKEYDYALWTLSRHFRTFHCLSFHIISPLSIPQLPLLFSSFATVLRRVALALAHLESIQ